MARSHFQHLSFHRKMGLVVLTGVPLAGVALVGGGGCVSNTKYEAALAESRAMKADLAAVQMKVSALEQQVSTLRDHGTSLDGKIGQASLEVERLIEQRDRERDQANSRLRNLERETDRLATDLRNLRQQYRQAKEANATLQSLVTRYEKELKEATSPVMSGSSSPLLPPPPAPEPPPAPSAGQVKPQQPAEVAQSTPVTPPSPPTPPPQPKQTPSPKPAPPPQPQEEEGWLGMISRWLSMIWDWLF